MTTATLFDVTRTNGREVEVVRRLDRATAERLVERDLNTGTTAYMEPSGFREGRVLR